MKKPRIMTHAVQATVTTANRKWSFCFMHLKHGSAPFGAAFMCPVYRKCRLWSSNNAVTCHTFGLTFTPGWSVWFPLSFVPIFKLLGNPRGRYLHARRATVKRMYRNSWNAPTSSVHPLLRSRHPRRHSRSLHAHVRPQVNAPVTCIVFCADWLNEVGTAALRQAVATGVSQAHACVVQRHMTTAKHVGAISKLRYRPSRCVSLNVYQQYSTFLRSVFHL